MHMHLSVFITRIKWIFQFIKNYCIKSQPLETKEVLCIVKAK